MSTFLKRTSPLIFRSILSTFIFVLNSVVIFDVTFFAIEVCTEGNRKYQENYYKKKQNYNCKFRYYFKKISDTRIKF